VNYYPVESEIAKSPKISIDDQNFKDYEVEPNILAGAPTPTMQPQDFATAAEDLYGEMFLNPRRSRMAVDKKKPKRLTKSSS
jgi:hypothetical protein